VQYRPKIAKDLLQKSNYSLKRIAEDVGLQSVQYFHSVFKRHFKCTPAEFRHGPGRV
jgi:AraC-like DNA-binding protein